jgi:membrane associated rhomboid family serine protease
MESCPRDGLKLSSDPRYGQVCGRCNGVLVPEPVLDTRHPEVLSLLQVETDEKSPAFAIAHECPGCRHMLAPWRITGTGAHVFRCTTCQWSWMPRTSLTALLSRAQKKAASDAYQSLSQTERQELARGIAAGQALPPSLSPTHALLAMLGLPVVTNIDRRRAPLLTWGIAGVIVLVFLTQALADGGVSGTSTRLAYNSDDPGLWPAVRAVFLHAGFLHLAGNLYFLLAFGDGVEQRLGRPAMLAAFIGAGALTLVLDGWAASRPTLIVGASGGIAVLIGACIVLQPQARVVTSILGVVFRVGIIGYGVIELGYQSVMSMLGVAGVAWTAHLSGLVMGAILGLALRRQSSA